MTAGFIFTVYIYYLNNLRSTVAGGLAIILFNMTHPSCLAFGNVRVMTDLQMPPLQINAVIALGTHKGLALQGLNSSRRVEDSSAKPKLIAPGLLNLCVNDTVVFPPPPQQMPQGLPRSTCRQGCASRCGACSAGRLLALPREQPGRATHTAALETAPTLSRLKLVTSC